MLFAFLAMRLLLRLQVLYTKALTVRRQPAEALTHLTQLGGVSGLTLAG